VIVVDASALLDLILGTGRARAVAARIDDPEITLHAPHLLDLEILQVLRRHAAAGANRVRIEQALDAFRDLEIARWSHELLFDRVWALRHNLTAYDASYVALAEALDAPLVTCDAQLAASRGHHARVEVIA
jgi:predicted nucleic acid-binding protein